MNMHVGYIDQLMYWINERENIRMARLQGGPRPWTHDPILQKYHFCNIWRQYDRGTLDIYKARMGLDIPTVELPAFFTVARLFNRADTLVEYWTHSIEGVKYRKAMGHRVFNTAYVVSTCGVSMDKIDYVHDVVEQVRNRAINPLSCERAFFDLRTINGLGSFLCGQIVADLKYTPYLEEAPDWWTFAVMGPGSKKGLDHIFYGGTTERNFKIRLEELHEHIRPHIPKMHAQDLQNCLCEMSKFVRYKENLPGRRRLY